MDPLWIFQKDFISRETAENPLNYKKYMVSELLETFKNSASLDFEIQARAHRARGQKLDL
jgi:hypothetical protein